jgi:hypothetical protein
MRAKYGNFPRGGASRNERHYDVIIHLNGQTLTARGYKIFPTEYWGWGSEHTEQEERIVSQKDEIKPISDVIQDVHVYVDPQLKNNWSLDRMYRINELAKKYDFPVFFYNDERYFKTQRTDKATRDINTLGLAKIQWTPDEEEWKIKSAQLGLGLRKSEYLDSFLKIYREEPLSDDWHDKRVMDWMLYYPHDAYTQLAAEIHNLKKYHPPVFKEVAAIMKKHGFKTFKELVTFVIKRENKKYKDKK